MKTILIINILTSFVDVVLLFILVNSMPKKKKRKKSLLRCDCDDVNQCNKRCHAKELFIKDSKNGKI